MRGGEGGGARWTRRSGRGKKGEQGPGRKGAGDWPMRGRAWVPRGASLGKRMRDLGARVVAKSLDSEAHKTRNRKPIRDTDPN